MPEDEGHGWQSSLTPAEVYACGLTALDAHSWALHGAALADVPSASQDEVLAACERGELDIGDRITSATFFELLRTNVVEGVLSDPRHGGNRNLAGWRWLGFPGDPGARGEPYRLEIEQHDVAYAVDPRALPLVEGA
jgi:gluconate 2-dehydrogenase gamma chain